MGCVALLLAFFVMVFVDAGRHHRKPKLSETFSCRLTEIDDTANGTVILEQLLRRDPVAQRSYMAANGSLVKELHTTLQP